MVPPKAPVVRFGGAMAGLPVWAPKRGASKKRVKHGALSLGGRHFSATHNNQPIVSKSSRRDVGEEARRG